MEFSNDGTLLALCCKNNEKATIKIFEIDGETREEYQAHFQQKLQNNDFLAEFTDKDDEDISFVKSLRFDNNNEYLVGYGGI